MLGRDNLGRQTQHGLLAAVLALSLITMTQSGTALAEDLDLHPSFASDPIPGIWERADGGVADGDQTWIWGPAIRAATHEPYADSPGGVRSVYYFDKARMEINNPNESWDSIWYATSGLLIREMMLGKIQIGDHRSIETAPAEIPVTGDLEDNPDSPTYATLGQHTTLDGQEQNRANDRTGEPVTTLMHADGSLSTDFSPPAESAVAHYDDTLGHNVPGVFWDWMNNQSIGWTYLTGHPVTEAYWVNTQIEGEPRQVMVQAFERRVLTFNPANEAAWQVEAGNAGLHYRAWRELSMPDDEAHHALAHEVPYGEIIVDAAARNGIDPFMLAGVADAASGFDPAASLPGDRIGLLGLPSQLAQQQGVEYPLDPAYNARAAADLLAMLQNERGDWEAAVHQYFDSGNGTADAAITAGHEFRNQLHGEPSPFDWEPPADDPPPVEEEVEAEDQSESSSEDVGHSGLRFIGAGEAAHYGQGYTVAEMEDILEAHASWSGGAVDGWDYDPNGYYCAHPDFIPGERLHLTAPDGQEFWCTIADYVAVEDRSYWYSRWAIEVNWKLFEAMGVPYEETIEVRAPIQ